MENTTIVTEIAPAPKRPQLLQVICILSFIACGLMILLYMIGSLLMMVGPETAEKVHQSMSASNPGIADTDPETLCHDIGLASLLGFVITIVSLIGVIMMWKLNKTGFYIYVLAELAMYFVPQPMKQESGMGMMALGIFLDVLFIVMYAINLKHMNRGGAAPAHA